ncbi:glutaminase A [uncultured Anaerococcus sp.]|uniref:glutaminase A n=1 Tax=uncultured Anaerococcus sp. TaxID=293428 RepID=UPI002613A1BA|nr:glutaminase A [uncultured Anaerococcus sp.]
MLYKKDYIDEKIRTAIKATESFKGVGELAHYIPELSNVDPDSFALSIVTVSGEVFNYGEYEKEFSLQSISKVLSLIMALHDNDPMYVFSKVGSEPTSYEFNSLMPITDKAANPFINAGAMSTTSMILGKDVDDKFDRLLEFYKKISGYENARLMEDVYTSELETTDRNRAIAHYLKSINVFEEKPEQVLDLYIKSCSMSTRVSAIARMGAVLANKGFDLDTHYNLLSKSEVQIVVSQMASCGMYENSGKYLMNVGIPSKSGVSGGILGVVPGVCGIGVYSPRLDKTGNSVRGKELFNILGQEMDLSIFIN